MNLQIGENILDVELWTRSVLSSDFKPWLLLLKLRFFKDSIALTCILFKLWPTDKHVL